MKELSKLLAEINLSPTCLTGISWVIETNEFRKPRIREILRGVINAELRETVGDYIIDAWYDAVEEDDSFFDLKDPVGYDECYGCEIMEYRFQPERNKISRECDSDSIEDYIKTQMEVCAKNDAREQKLKRLQWKADRDIALLSTPCKNNENTLEAISQYAKETALSEIEEFESEECIKTCPKIAEVKKQTEIEAVRKLVEGLILYAEQFTHAQNDKADVIRNALLEKIVHSYIPKEVWTPELVKRRKQLGRKTPPSPRIENNYRYENGATHNDNSHYLNVNSQPFTNQIEQHE